MTLQRSLKNSATLRHERLLCVYMTSIACRVLLFNCKTASPRVIATSSSLDSKWSCSTSSPIIFNLSAIILALTARGSPPLSYMEWERGREGERERERERKREREREMMVISQISSSLHKPLLNALFTVLHSSMYHWENTCSHVLCSEMFTQDSNKITRAQKMGCYTQGTQLTKPYIVFSKLNCKNKMFGSYRNSNNLKSVPSFVHLYRQSILIGTK